MDRRFPKFDNKIDPKAEREITLSLQRIYDFIDEQKRELAKGLSKLGSSQQDQIANLSSLVAGFGTKLIGLTPSNNNPLTQLGSGTVTSVGLNGIANFITISGSPITGSSSFSLSLSTQIANKVFAGPTTGAAAVPTFRSLVTADFPIGVLQSVNSKITAAAPYTNDGYIEVTINGITIRLMTTA